MSVLFAALLGVLGWTLTEYVFHRFFGHVLKQRTEFGREHLKHHREQLYFAPASSKAKLAAVTSLLVGAVAVPVAGWVHGVVFTASLVGGYLVYESVHRDLHVRAPTGPYGRWARRHHMVHHHMAPHLNHGVTSPLWDLVFRTWAPSDHVRIPRAKAPTWLHQAGDRPFAESYEMFGR